MIFANLYIRSNSKIEHQCVHVQFHKFQLYDAEPFDVHAFGEKCTHVASKAGKLPALILTPIDE